MIVLQARVNNRRVSEEIEVCRGQLTVNVISIAYPVLVFLRVPVASLVAGAVAVENSIYSADGVLILRVYIRSPRLL